MTDIGPDCYAYAINADGEVAGYRETAGKKGHRAFLYRPGVGMKDLGTLGDSVGMALRINDLGQMVGSSAAAETSDGARRSMCAFLYADGSGMKDLGVLAGGSASCAFGINGKGQVVGDAIDSHGAFHAFLYQPDGTMIDLGAAVDSTLGWTLNCARAINDSGQIAGYGTAPDGNTRAFLLVPLVKARDAGATDARKTATVGATTPTVGEAVKLSPQPQAKPSTPRGERRLLPMNH